MTCAAFWELTVDLARGGVADPAIRNAALAHALQCPRCGRRLGEERTLTEDLRALAEADRNKQAGPTVQASLLDALHTVTLSRPVPPARRWGWAAGLAASILLAWVLAVTLSGGGGSERPVAEPPAASAAAADDTDAEGSSEVLTEFVPLRYGDPLADLDSLQLVRVRLPAGALGALGGSLDEGREPRPVDADVILGHDGVARAIRFVR